MISNVEFPADSFFKAHGSGDAGCVEVSLQPHGIGVRDSKQLGGGPVLAFTAHEWDVFIAAAKAGEFDRR